MFRIKPMVGWILGWGCLWACSFGHAFAGLTVTTLGARSPSALVAQLAGSGITYSNVTYLGSTTSSGTFTGGSTIVGFDSGILLTTGLAASVIGPNTGVRMSFNLGLAGDSDLSTMTGQTTYDATVLEFDFVPQQDSVHFDYVFGSDEYNTFVGQFNDAFAFFLDGVNVALLPNTSVFVSINNVNNCANPSYYINNVAGASSSCSVTAAIAGKDTAMDGFTTVLSVQQQVTPGTTHHLKLAIADVSDAYYDSYVFIRANSLLSGNTPTETWTPTSTSTWTDTSTITATFTSTATATPTQSPTITSTSTQTDTTTSTSSWTVTFTPTESLTPTETWTSTETLTATETATWTLSPTFTVTFTVTKTPTVTWTPTITDTPTMTMTPTPTETPLGPLHLWPNPFNPPDAVRGTLKCADMPAGSVLAIYTVSGETVMEAVEMGYRVEWDGKARNGKPVAPGIYYYVVRLGKEKLLEGVLMIVGAS